MREVGEYSAPCSIFHLFLLYSAFVWENTRFLWRLWSYAYQTALFYTLAFCLLFRLSSFDYRYMNFDRWGLSYFIKL
jgi:hypothetical protein